MPDRGQEFEALEELVELEGTFGPIYPPYTNLKWQAAWEKARAALAAREEPQGEIDDREWTAIGEQEGQHA